MELVSRLGRTGTAAAYVAVLALMVAPTCANAQYAAPPPDPGFEYIFDGTPTGSDASFDKWVFASSTAEASATQGQATLDPVEGAMLVGASPFGAYWYPVRPLGDVVIRLQYTVQDIPTSTRNGGVMIRSPEVRYTGATTSDVLAQKPDGYNYDVCPGAIPLCGLRPRHRRRRTRGGRRRALPAGLRRLGSAVPLLGRILRAKRRPQRHQPRRHRSAHDQRQRQQPPTLDAGLLRP